jgi:hypothetical protein
MRHAPAVLYFLIRLPRVIRKRAKLAIAASQKARRIARLAQILRFAKSALLRMTFKVE